MAKFSWFSLSLCLVVLFQGSLAIGRRYQSSESYRRLSVCQLDRLDALNPDTTTQAEAGKTETWNPINKQFQCPGVAFLRRTIEANGLLLPSYINTPQLIYVVHGKAVLGTVFPGCAETFEESQQGQSHGWADRHQKLRHVREGDIIALPAGVAYWKYNHGDQPFVYVALLDTSNVENQLDQIPRRFYLAGNPEEEFKQIFQQFSRDPSRQEPERSSENKQNIFRGINSRFWEEAFNVDAETVRKLRGVNDNRNNIVRVRGKLELVSPVMRSRGEYQQEEEMERERERERSYDNGLEETFCTMSIKKNIGKPSSADFFTPQAGRISTVNSFNLPILRYLRLSAEKGNLYSNAIHTPHWNLNSHSIIYVIRGSARIQVVDHFGRNFFDGEVRQGQVLTVPQHHVIVKQAASDGLEWVSFKTNDQAAISPLAGRSSVIRALPEAVLMNAFQISREQAKQLKYNREETFLLASSRSSERRAVA